MSFRWPITTSNAILCIAVLEHVINPEESLAELYRVLKPGGHLVLEVPFPSSQSTRFPRTFSDTPVMASRMSSGNTVSVW